MEHIDCEMFLAIKLMTFKNIFVCKCCQLAVVLEDQTAKLEQLVDFLVKIDEYDRIIDDVVSIKCKGSNDIRKSVQAVNVQQTDYF